MSNILDALLANANAHTKSKEPKRDESKEDASNEEKIPLDPIEQVASDWLLNSTKSADPQPYSSAGAQTLYGTPVCEIEYSVKHVVSQSGDSVAIETYFTSKELGQYEQKWMMSAQQIKSSPLNLLTASIYSRSVEITNQAIFDNSSLINNKLK